MSRMILKMHCKMFACNSPKNVFAILIFLSLRMPVFSLSSVITLYMIGGGEAPKSMSGRVLVAAYWLFVVLMLATFTANLAAFLTVERMQTTVQVIQNKV